MSIRCSAGRGSRSAIWSIAAVALATAWAGGGVLSAQSPPPPSCATDSAFTWLDFWVGRWDVLVGNAKVGQDDVTKILSGCAVTESWTAASGQRGFSLFYFLPATRTWRQVWVTERALGRGGVKEKALIDRFPDGSVRFQGTVRLPSGGSYLDRTTLTPLAGGRVRQLIEPSTDEGHTWEAGFDAVYVPRP